MQNRKSAGVSVVLAGAGTVFAAVAAASPAHAILLWIAATLSFTTSAAWLVVSRRP